MGREDEITKQREIPYPYSIDPDEMIERFEQFYTAAVSDVMINPRIEGCLNMEST